jgi:hypothetical protein
VSEPTTTTWRRRHHHHHARRVVLVDEYRFLHLTLRSGSRVLPHWHDLPNHDQHPHDGHHHVLLLLLLLRRSLLLVLLAPAVLNKSSLRHSPLSLRLLLLHCSHRRSISEWVPRRKVVAVVAAGPLHQHDL